MRDQLSELNLREDFEKVLPLAEAARWVLENPTVDEVVVTIYPVSAPEEHFQARLLWQEYPDAPPSLKFRDPETRRLDLPGAWPVVRGFRPGTLDACVNWCAEGMALHPEWRTDPRYRWDNRGNVLLKVLRI